MMSQFAPSMVSVARRSRVALAVVCGAMLAGSAAAQIKGIDITAPAGPGGGYDQLARATRQILQSEGLATGVQVSNVPGAGGTIGLAQFVTGKKRGTNQMVAGLGMVGAILTNKSPITLQQVTPLARLQGEYQPLVVAAELADQDAGRPHRKVQGRSRLCLLGWICSWEPRSHPVRFNRAGDRGECNRRCVEIISVRKSSLCSSPTSPNLLQSPIIWSPRRSPASSTTI